MRKKRNVRRVIGWLLSFQLSEPAAGACCALSMAGGLVCGKLHVLRGIWLRLEMRLSGFRNACRRVGV